MPTVSVAENMMDLIDGYCRLEQDTDDSVIYRPNKGMSDRYWLKIKITLFWRMEHIWVAYSLLSIMTNLCPRCQCAKLPTWDSWIVSGFFGLYRGIKCKRYWWEKYFFSNHSEDTLRSRNLWLRLSLTLSFSSGAAGTPARPDIVWVSCSIFLHCKCVLV